MTITPELLLELVEELESAAFDYGLSMATESVSDQQVMRDAEEFSKASRKVVVAINTLMKGENA